MSDPYIPAEDRIDVIGRLTARLDDGGQETLREKAAAQAESISGKEPVFEKPDKEVEKENKEDKGANSLIIAVFGEEEQSGDCCEHALELVDRAAVAAAFPAEHPPCLHLCHGVLDGGADLAEDGVEFTLPVEELRSAEALERHDPDAVDSDVAEVGASIS